MKRDLLTAGLLLLLISISYSTESSYDHGFLSARIHEYGSNTLTPCRAWVEIGKDRYFIPLATTGIPYQRDKSFSYNGEFLLQLPAGSGKTDVASHFVQLFAMRHCCK